MSTGYLPALDGLRALSIALVLAAHAGLDRVVPGAFGVTLFFFISGALITAQLRARLAATGRLGWRGFYLRRAVRLMPAAFAYILLAGGTYVLAGGAITLWGWAAALGYSANLYDLAAGYRSSLPGIRHPFNILWSLAIEEQFYLVWPLALAALWRARAALGAVLALCAAVLLWRAWLFHACGPAGRPWICAPLPPNPLWHQNRLYLGTDTRIDSIAWGAVLALLPARLAGLGARSAAARLAALALLALAFAFPGEFGRYVLRPSLQGAALLVLIPAALAAGGTVGAVLRHPALVLGGRLSYSLYLWHWAALAVADAAARPGTAAWLAIALPLTAGLAAASYLWLERPLLALRRRLGSAVPPPGTAAATPASRPAWRGARLRA